MMAVAGSPARVPSDVFDHDEPETFVMEKQKTTAGPPVGAMTPTKTKTSVTIEYGVDASALDAGYNNGAYGVAFSPLREPKQSPLLDAAYNDGSAGVPFEPLSEPPPPAPLDAAYNDGSAGVPFEPLPDAAPPAPLDAGYNDGAYGVAFSPLREVAPPKPLDAAYNDGSAGLPFEPLPDAAPAAPLDAAYNDGSAGLPFEPLEDKAAAAPAVYGEVAQATACGDVWRDPELREKELACRMAAPGGLLSPANICGARAAPLPGAGLARALGRALKAAASAEYHSPDMCFDMPVNAPAPMPCHGPRAR